MSPWRGQVTFKRGGRSAKRLNRSALPIASCSGRRFSLTDSLYSSLYGVEHSIVGAREYAIHPREEQCVDVAMFQNFHHIESRAAIG